MKVNKSFIQGSYILEPKVFGDNRGFFLETYNLENYKSILGENINFVQDNHSYSILGSLRGLHFQLNKPQGKLVRVIQGEVLDVVVDLRKNSPTFLSWDSVILSGDNKKQFWVPEKMKLSHIMFINESGSLNKDTQLQEKKAEDILRRIQAGEKFAVLAEKYSDDVSAHSGGHLGAVGRGTMLLKFERAAFDLKVGEVSDIVETANGLHIIKCDNIIPGHAKTFKLVESEIKNILSSKKREKKYNKWMAELKKKSFISVSLVLDGKKNKNKRTFNAVVKKESFNNPQTIDPDRYSRTQNNDSQDEDLSVKRLVEKKLNKYKKLYAGGEISRKTYLIKKKQLLEKL